MVWIIGDVRRREKIEQAQKSGFFPKIPFDLLKFIIFALPFDKRK